MRQMKKNHYRNNKMSKYIKKSFCRVMIIGIDQESFSFSLYGRNFAFGRISNISENMNRNEKESFRYESPEDLTKTTGGAVPPPP